MKGHSETLSETAIERVFLDMVKEQIALRNEAKRARERAIKRARNEVVTAALMGETRLYLESD